MCDDLCHILALLFIHELSMQIHFYVSVITSILSFLIQVFNTLKNFN